MHWRYIMQMISLGGTIGQGLFLSSGTNLSQGGKH